LTSRSRVRRRSTLYWIYANFIFRPLSLPSVSPASLTLAPRQRPPRADILVPSSLFSFPSPLTSLFKHLSRCSSFLHPPREMLSCDRVRSLLISPLFFLLTFKVLVLVACCARSFYPRGWRADAAEDFGFIRCDLI